MSVSSLPNFTEIGLKGSSKGLINRTGTWDFEMATLNDLATITRVILLADTPSAHAPSSSVNSQFKSSSCLTNCSGHGLCHQGECWCEVQFRGHVCETTNFLYYGIFSLLFFLLSIVSLVQLAVCIQAEYHKHQKPCLKEAFRVTNQKLVYCFVTIATASRGLYFAIQLSHPIVSFNLQTVYYPLILTIFSLLVCFWAESFHIRDLRQPAPFLTKSVGAFIAFNVILYILLFVQLLATNTWVHDIAGLLTIFSVIDLYIEYINLSMFAGKRYWMRISKACFASLTLFVVVFFLIYGIEVFFKVRGAFVDANKRLNRFVACFSRLSLIAQAGSLLFLAFFLFSDVAFIHFDKKINDLGISYFDTACRAVDLCVAIWFPLVLWKCARPNELWLLNPRLLLRANLDTSQDESVIDNIEEVNNGKDSEDAQCFICYDMERDDAGALISPCKCKVSVFIFVTKNL